MQNVIQQTAYVGASHAIDTSSRKSAYQFLHFPTPMLRDIEKCAASLDQSESWCMRMAWSIACGDISDMHATTSGHRMLKGRKRPLRVELPMGTWLHIALESERLDRSRSWLLQRAWLIARPRISGALK